MYVVFQRAGQATLHQIEQPLVFGAVRLEMPATDTPHLLQQVFDELLAYVARDLTSLPFAVEDGEGLLYERPGDERETARRELPDILDQGLRLGPALFEVAFELVASLLQCPGVLGLPE